MAASMADCCPEAITQGSDQVTHHNMATVLVLPDCTPTAGTSDAGMPGHKAG